MNKKEVAGSTQEIKGKMEQGMAKVTGRQKTQAHGKDEEAKGKATKAAGQIEGKLASAKADVKGKIHRATK